MRTGISPVWAALALYPEREAAEAAITNNTEFLPCLDVVAKSWHAALQPFAHRGEANYLDSNKPGLFLDPPETDPGGSLVAATTAGFDLRPNFDLERIKDFSLNLDKVLDWMASADGLITKHSLVSPDGSSEGFTVTIWRDDRAVLDFAYRPGVLRIQLERNKAEQTADRTTFTRCCATVAKGQWEGINPVEAAGKIA